MTKKHLITAALPYANWPLHVGHVAWVHLPGDIYARFLRIMGHDVVTLCWTDDHGVGIEIAAKKEGIPELELVTKYKEVIISSLEKIGISYDIFSQTHSATHMKNASSFFSILQDKGYIEKRAENMAFCDGCDNFLPDRYVEGTCPNCWSAWARWDQCEKCGKLLNPTDLIDPECKMCSSDKVTTKETYNYYFLLSKFQTLLEEWIKTKEWEWKPNVLSATKKWLTEWLNDRSISRDIKWGIPIPGDSEKKMYVWFEAPIGYISFLKELCEDRDEMKEFSTIWDKWDNSDVVHFIWKDNIVFHTIIWPALLMAHGWYNLPKNVPGNEFLNLENAKISTSRNHAVWLHEIVDLFNSDTIRYYLTHCIPEKKDSNFTWDEFKERNNELANVLWNLLNRLTTFCAKNFNWTVDSPDYSNSINAELRDYILTQWSEISSFLEKYAFRDALRELFLIFQKNNKFIHDNAPWTLIKTDKKAAQEIINVSIDCLIKTTILMEPFLPDTAKKILATFGVPKDEKFTYQNLEKFPDTYPLSIQESAILFKKIDDADLQVVKANISQ